MGRFGQRDSSARFASISQSRQFVLQLRLGEPPVAGYRRPAYRDQVCNLVIRQPTKEYQIDFQPTGISTVYDYPIG